ncbi:MAG: phospho-N-acetylmuramoyl-pentapeptide-transferase [Elusimicrobia bacterium RIFCSPLOWO2_02_FULL_39_32]|nr:MAG: phospho-N-acetylmuramoyl-pentapeptide-transferase [Elusimicrobia bacterium RIFCSPHIGHO2_02_FULL_39_36]OGR93161.1 MAG: phospho-N-acetylmuramoyl-pentapeptide-transferase [Elusimicrobia bacterium RIFCSPLOWO2_02_FULL_39_32]OGR99386.1 MAG: phospho-N-acetylmuramoyl-pentapeptide-transferase [Elusimicrobia bacterium RIFCSPLOWO2_12_FULL_39_28]
MLYFLSYFKDTFSPLNLLTYITFRAGGAILTSMIFTWFLAPKFIACLRKAKMSQPIRNDGPPTHQVKSGTPSMGGILILSATLGSTLLWAKLDNRFIILSLMSALYLGLLGFLDDFLKWKDSLHYPKGLSPLIKISAQLFLAIIISAYFFYFPPNHEYATKINVPYFKSLFINLGIWTIFFSVMIIVGSSNAVNLTDGLDGLAIGSLIISSLTYALFAYLAGHAKFSQYLGIIPVPGAGELTVFLAASIGAGLGFLWYNCYPAEIFMGDTGSLFLGGVLGITAVSIKQELILIIVGGLFVSEALSVLLQVYSFRARGKRIFKMAPLHHHFELLGWQEPKVTARFLIVAIVLSLIALASLKIR